VARTCAQDVNAVVRPEDAADAMLVTSVYQEHGRAMRAYALRLRDTYIDDTAVDDIVQEALVRIWRHPEVLSNGRGSVRGWLFKTMRNIAADWARARAVRPPEVRCPSNSDYSQIDLVSNRAAVRDPADDVDAAIDTAALVLPALDRLTPAQRDAIERRYFLHQTPAQAAAELGDGVTPHAVKLRVHQGLRALRAELRRQPAEGASP
jgi:RNA polymerase sigma-70 factor (ECF subfamily)